MALVYIGLGILLLFGFALGRNALQVAALRRKGLYPQPGRATMDDVRRLVQSRKSVLAIRCYRELYPKVSLKKAKEVIDEIALKETSN